MTFDYRNGLVYLKPNSALNNKFEHDMSGLEIYMEEGTPDRYFIERIEPASPAEKIGILPGDEVLGINFKDMQSLDLEAVVVLLKAGDGKNVVLKLNRNGELLFKVLTLKKRI
jgi:C-terminal processing protease CtpA/Prc